MYYNVVVKDEYRDYVEGNKLVFHFEDDKKKALEFLEYITDVSDYHVELLQFYEDEEEKNV